jgi:hypothetical protein
VAQPLYGEARSLIVRIVQMLTRLADRMATMQTTRKDM